VEPTTNAEQVAMFVWLATGYQAGLGSRFDISRQSFTYEMYEGGRRCLQTDDVIFRFLRHAAYQSMGTSRMQRIMFPCRIDRVEYREFWHQRPRVVMVEDKGEGLFPDDEGRTHGQPNTCRNTNGWDYCTRANYPSRRTSLGSQRLTTIMLSPERIQGSNLFGKLIPRNTTDFLELQTVIDSGHGHDDHIWGVVVHKKFDYVSCVLVWFMITFVASLTVILPLAMQGPLRGNVVGASGIFFGLMTLANTWAVTVSVNHAKGLGIS